MAPRRRRLRSQEIEDIVFKRIFLVALEPYQISNVVLSELKEASEGKPLAEKVRVLNNRLSGFLSQETPFRFLVGCYRCACDHLTRVASLKNSSNRAQSEQVISIAQKLVVKYCRFHCRTSASAKSDLMAMIFPDLSTPMDGFVGSPPNFIPEFFRDDDDSDVELVLQYLFEKVTKSVVGVSAFGNFQQPLKALLYLLKLPSGAKTLVNHPRWIPRETSLLMGEGRAIEMESILGPFLHVGGLTDFEEFQSTPHVGKQSYLEYFDRSNGQWWIPAFERIKSTMATLHNGLYEVFLTLYKKKDTQGKLFEYLIKMIEKNSAKSQVPLSCASTGTFLNLSWVMLSMCESFLYDPAMIKNIDHKYLFHNTHIDFRQLTTMHASSEEVSAWLEEENSSKDNHELEAQEGTSNDNNSETSTLKHGTRKKNYPLICERFFMTARVLNLGLIATLLEYRHLRKQMERCKNDLSINQMREEHEPHSSQLLDEAIQLDEKMVELTADITCYQGQIFIVSSLLPMAVAFYRLVINWLVDLVGGFKMPLPSTCPMEFASVPEHFVNDVMDFLIQICPLMAIKMEGYLPDFLNFIIMFMASPDYVRNPHLRAQMVEVLNIWIPQKSGLSATFFEGHQLPLDYLVKNLFKVYVNIELTGSELFIVRYDIFKILKCVRNVRSHRDAWRHFAREEEGTYLKFLHFLIDDSMHLFDKCLDKMLQVKEIEAGMRATEWVLRDARSREETIRLHDSIEKTILFDMRLANEIVDIFVFTSERISAPFLLPEMVERVASMLFHFLLRLACPERRFRFIKDLKKYEFRSTQLLKQIVQIYIHLARADREDVFPAAISKDGWTYQQKVFTTTAGIISKICEDNELSQEFIQLAVKAKYSKTILGEPPEEFMDPIKFELMRDPVILPSTAQSSKISVDRSVIERHLENSQTNPFTNTFLNRDMLIPNVELKQRIEDFISQRKQSRGPPSSPS